MKSSNSLDENVEKIYQETMADITSEDKPVELPGDEELQRGYMILSDEHLPTMLPGRETDILINAHLPLFDLNPIPHMHTFYELIYVHKGVLWMSIGDRKYTFAKNDFILLNPSAIHLVSLGQPGSRVINFMMKQSLLRKSFFHIILNNPLFADFIFPSAEKNKPQKDHIFFRDAGSNNPALISYLENILKEYTENQYLNESALEINFAGLCLELARFNDRQSAAVPDEGNSEKQSDFSLTEVCRYLTENLDSATLKETAAYFHYNPKYFSDLLKKTYGKNFSGLLLDLKMGYAAELLANTDLSVTKIIQQLGYKNNSHFYRMFEQVYGMKPLEYRKSRNL